MKTLFVIINVCNADERLSKTHRMVRGLGCPRSRDTVGQLSDKLYFVRNKQSYHLKKKLAGDSRRRGFYGQMSTTRTPYLVLFKNYKYDFISSFHIAKFISAFYFSLDFSKSSSLKGLLSQNRYVYIQIIYETTDYLFEKLTRFRSQF